MAVETATALRATRRPARAGPLAASVAGVAGVGQGESILDLTLPARIGPMQFAAIGKLVAGPLPAGVRLPHAQGRGLWEPGARRWLVERRRVGPLIRALRRETDPLFRQAGISLDWPASPQAIKTT
jgi:hypothetical protein